MLQSQRGNAPPLVEEQGVLRNDHRAEFVLGNLREPIFHLIGVSGFDDRNE